MDRCGLLRASSSCDGCLHRISYRARLLLGYLGSYALGCRIRWPLNWHSMPCWRLSASCCPRGVLMPVWFNNTVYPSEFYGACDMLYLAILVASGNGLGAVRRQGNPSSPILCYGSGRGMLPHCHAVLGPEILTTPFFVYRVGSLLGCIWSVVSTPWVWSRR